MKKLKVIFCLLLFAVVISLNVQVKAAEQLPDNGAKISSAQIIQTKTGTGPWDDDDEPGNDSSEDNNIVRSFDQVTWTIENTFVLKDAESGIDSYSGGTIFVKVSLPQSAKNIIRWNTDAMGWAEDTGVLSSDGLTFTGEYHMSETETTIPGKQSLIFAIDVLGALNEYEIEPTFELWLNGNSESDKQMINPEKVIVSSAPKYNIRLVRKSIKRYLPNPNNSGEYGIVHGFWATLQLYNSDQSKKLKGIEYPTGDITFDLNVKLEKTDKKENLIEDVTDTMTPILYNYSLNGNDGTSNSAFRDGRLFMSYYQEGYVPNANRAVYDKASLYYQVNAMYKTGNITMVQDGDVIHVTVKNYDFDGHFPIRFSGGVYKPITAQITDNIGYFSSMPFQIYIPVDENKPENVMYYLTVSDSNFDATSLSGIQTSEQGITTDDSLRNSIELFGNGNYYKHHQFFNENLVSLHKSVWNSPDVVAYKGQRVWAGQMVCQSSTNDPISHAVYGGNFLVKIDTRGFEVLPEIDGRQYRSDGGWFTFQIAYAAKPDGSEWSSLEEQDNR